MIVDNADDAGVHCESQHRDTTTMWTSFLADYLPQSFKGSIVVTTQSQEVLKRLHVYDEDNPDVGSVRREIDQNLLRQKLKKGDEGRATMTWPSCHTVRRYAVGL